MIRKRCDVIILRTAAIVAGVCVLLGVVSYFGPFTIAWEPDEQSCWRLAINDGHAWVLRVDAQLATTYDGWNPSAEEAARWAEVRPRIVGWTSWTRWLTEEDRVDPFALCFSLFLPAIVLALPWTALRVTRSQRARWRFALREIIWPSRARTMYARMGRWFVRVAMAVIALVFGLLAVFLVHGYWGRDISLQPQFVDLWGHGFMMPQGASMTVGIERRFRMGRQLDFEWRQGRLFTVLSTPISESTVVVPVDRTVAGVRWWIRRETRIPERFPGYTALSNSFPLRASLSFGSDARQLSVDVPILLPLLSLAVLLFVAFVFGPWRRAGRRLRGACLQCGYNLTGNVSGKCPECGKAIATTRRVATGVSIHMAVPHSGQRGADSPRRM